MRATMAGGKAGFLNQLTGDFVKYLRGDAVVRDYVGTDEDAKIFPEAARQGAPLPYIVYTQAGGHSDKHLGGLDGCEEMTLHVYAHAEDPNNSRALARAIHDRMLPTSAIVGDGTKLHICNGGITDSGFEDAKESSDRKRFWTRLVLRMVISD